MIIRIRRCKNEEKGFTLVELLAVIVILAVIALIAVPTILGVIDKAKKESFKRTLEGILKAAELYQAQLYLNDYDYDCAYFSFEYPNGITIEEDDQLITYLPLSKLSLKGELPTEGELKVCKNEITMNASNGIYSGNYDGKNITVSDDNSASNNIEIILEPSDGWSKNKKVTLNGSLDGFKLQYQITKYNISTSQDETSDWIDYSDSFVLEALANDDHKISIKVHYTNGTDIKCEKTFYITNIDTVIPNIEAPTVVASADTPQAIVVTNNQTDSDSGIDSNTLEYGYSLSANGEYVWQSNNTITNLKAGTTYYIRTRVNDIVDNGLSISNYTTIDIDPAVLNEACSNVGEESNSYICSITNISCVKATFGAGYPLANSYIIPVNYYNASKLATLDTTSSFRYNASLTSFIVPTTSIDSDVITMFKDYTTEDYQAGTVYGISKISETCKNDSYIWKEV